MYAATSLTLAIAPDGGNIVVAWPTEFTGFDLYCKTNLLEAGWTFIPGITNRWIDLPPLAQQKFYRLYKPHP